MNLFRTLNFGVIITSTLLIGSLSSCTKNEACIDGPAEIKIKDEATFTFCGTYKELRWEVYDGVETTEYTGESISHTFNHLTDEAYVTAYAEGKNNEDKNDSETMEFSVTGSVFLEVKDASGATVSGANITIFKDEACWEDPSGSGCTIATGTTDATGKAEFEELVVDGTYFVEVTTDDYQSNWGTTNNYSQMVFTSGLDEFTGSEEVLNTFEVDRDIRYLISSASKWQLVKVRNSGGSDIWNAVPTCRKDDHLLFDRELNWTLSEGADQCNPPFIGAGKYTNQAISAYPPTNLDVTVTNSTGDLDMSGDKFTIVDENNIKFVVSATSQTYELQRQ